MPNEVTNLLTEGLVTGDVGSLLTRGLVSLGGTGGAGGGSGNDGNIGAGAVQGHWGEGDIHVNPQGGVAPGSGTITPPPTGTIASLAIDADAASVAAGESLTLQAYATFTDGRRRRIPVLWFMMAGPGEVAADVAGVDGIANSATYIAPGTARDGRIAQIGAQPDPAVYPDSTSVYAALELPIVPTVTLSAADLPTIQLIANAVAALIYDSEIEPGLTLRELYVAQATRYLGPVTGLPERTVPQTAVYRDVNNQMPRLTETYHTDGTRSVIRNLD